MALGNGLARLGAIDKIDLFSLNQGQNFATKLIKWKDKPSLADITTLRKGAPKLRKKSGVPYLLNVHKIFRIPTLSSSDFRGVPVVKFLRRYYGWPHRPSNVAQ